MTRKARNSWRFHLTIAVACLVVVGAISCWAGPIVGHVSKADVENSGSLFRAAVYYVHAERVGAGKPPPRGWMAHFERVWGTPLVALRPRCSLFDPGTTVAGWSICVPLWIPLALLGAPCAWLWWKHVRRPPGQCESCGYDLRGTAGDKCPECGAVKDPPDRRARAEPHRPNLWRLRRMFFRPVAVGVGLALLLTAASSYFYVYVKVWMFGTEDVMLVGLSGRTLCVQRVDYNQAIRERALFNAWHHIVAPPLQCWPTNRWVDAGWLGPDLHWESSWLPTFARRTNGWIVAVPWWNMAVLGIGFLAGLHYLQSRAFCRHCGYDLKDLPADICPECGHVFRRVARVTGENANPGSVS